MNRTKMEIKQIRHFERYCHNVSTFLLECMLYEDVNILYLTKSFDLNFFNNIFF